MENGFRTHRINFLKAKSWIFWDMQLIEKGWGSEDINEYKNSFKICMNWSTKVPVCDNILADRIDQSEIQTGQKGCASDVTTQGCSRERLYGPSHTDRAYNARETGSKQHCLRNCKRLKHSILLWHDATRRLLCTDTHASYQGIPCFFSWFYFLSGTCSGEGGIIPSFYEADLYINVVGEWFMASLRDP